MSAQISPITTQGDPRMDIEKIKAAISKKPIKSGLLVFGIVAIGVIIYYAALEPTYQCNTLTVGGISSCYKFKVSPLPRENLGKISDGACPNKPPSNCP